MTTISSTYPRRILLAVTGLTPQIVTETLYALAVVRQPPFIPTEIHLLTTKEGASRAQLMLLDPDKAHYARLCSDYGLTGQIAFDEHHIHVIKDVDGNALTDIRTPADNTSAADAITDFVRKFTSIEDSALHVSLAGGRKTMGFYLGYAMSLFGRPQDALSHVLVSEPFETNPDFFYPPREPKVLFTRDNKPIRTSDAKIMLAEIPFVRLRHRMPEYILDGEVSFTDTVNQAQVAVGPPELVIDLQRQRVRVGGRALKLQRHLLAFYAWMADRCVKYQNDQAMLLRDQAIPAEYLAIYAQLVGTHSGDYEDAERALRGGFDKNDFPEKRSKVNRALKKTLGAAGATPYLVASAGVKPNTRYGLRLTREQIRFADIVV